MSKRRREYEAKAVYRPKRPKKNVGMNRLNISPSGLGQKETKFVYTFSGANYVELATNVVTHLTPIAQGLDSDSDRIGNKVTGKWLTMYINVDNSKLEVSSAVSDQHCRLVIFADLNNVGTIPTATQLLKAAYTISCFHEDNRERFKILYDTMFTLSPTNQNDAQWTKKIQFPLNNQQIRFTTTAADGYGPGCIFLMLMCRSQGDTDKKTEYAYDCCVTYTDS